MRHYTTTEAGALLNLKVLTVVRYIEKGKLTATKQDGAWEWTLTDADITRFQEARRQPGRQPRPRRYQAKPAPVNKGGRPARPVADRFWEKVDRSGGPDACWPWIAALEHDGYGRFQTSHQGQARKVRAPRMAWLLTHGDIPDALCICHRCDNPPCCNPAHLWLGTNLENTQDKMQKGRHVSGKRKPAP